LFVCLFVCLFVFVCFVCLFVYLFIMYVSHAYMPYPDVVAEGSLAAVAVSGEVQ
jgi:hypothetical protein